MNINLHIEKLVLDGLPVGTHEGPLVQAAVEAELARLIEQGPFEQPIPLGRDGGPLAQLGNGSVIGPERLGKEIGQATFANLQPRLEPHLPVVKRLETRSDFGKQRLSHVQGEF